jgi:hypothetical protein
MRRSDWRGGRRAARVLSSSPAAGSILRLAWARGRMALPYCRTAAVRPVACCPMCHPMLSLSLSLCVFGVCLFVVLLWSVRARAWLSAACVACAATCNLRQRPPCAPYFFIEIIARHRALQRRCSLLALGRLGPVRRPVRPLPVAYLCVPRGQTGAGGVEFYGKRRK